MQKADGCLGLDSDGIIYGPDRLFFLLAVLFRAILVLAYAPDVLLLGTMSPIPKQNNMAHISDKYRAITLVSCILKPQFGFKSKSSTTLCTSMITETVRLFNSGNSKVFAVLLDATKALIG